ncbi:protein of unknown function (plasmid) [Azospirillum baldaniorum]|uniref:Uncharacterized protein n=1 Tax=Azospirillum baldaniorum TaxID=1064539 RepID=A0A9P1JX94_9PROT|nr:protein of unknown function [Azospirillum baldaniorum]
MVAMPRLSRREALPNPVDRALFCPPALRPRPARSRWAPWRPCRTGQASIAAGGPITMAGLQGKATMLTMASDGGALLIGQETGTALQKIDVLSLTVPKAGSARMFGTVAGKTDALAASAIDSPLRAAPYFINNTPWGPTEQVSRGRRHRGGGCPGSQHPRRHQPVHRHGDPRRAHAERPGRLRRAAGSDPGRYDPVPDRCGDPAGGSVHGRRNQPVHHPRRRAVGGPDHRPRAVRHRQPANGGGGGALRRAFPRQTFTLWIANDDQPDPAPVLQEPPSAGGRP